MAVDFPRCSSAPTMRVLGGGDNVVIPLATTVTLGTITKGSNEIIQLFNWVHDNVAALAFAQGLTSVLNQVVFNIVRTTTPDQFMVQATNGSLGVSRTVSWAVIALQISP